jgi:LPXTG-site transpeptidase (sortase) family protein
LGKANLSLNVKNALKKFLKWYSYPLIYFFITGFVCACAWYSRPFSHRGGIEAAFKTISVIPALLWAAVITVWIAAATSLIVIRFKFKKRFAEPLIWNKAKRFIQGGNRIHVMPSDKKATISLWRKTLNILVSALSIVLVVAGLSLAIWITRPYFNLLLSTSRIEALEKKAKLGQVQGNRIIIPSVLVDAPILEGVTQGQLSRGVCHVSQSPAPGEGGNCIIEGHNLAEFGWWKPQSFFSMLEVVDKGTPIYVFYNGKKYTYTVREKTYKNVSDPKLYDSIPGERLTLLTCVSTWSPTIYTNRKTLVIAYPAKSPEN